MRAALALALAIALTGCSKRSEYPRSTVWSRSDIAGLESMHPDECSDVKCVTAAEPCTAAHYQRRRGTIEGKRIIDDYFRVPTNGRCEFILYGDRSANTYGQCDVTKEVCRSLSVSKDGELMGGDCAPAITVYVAPDCH